MSEINNWLAYCRKVVKNMNINDFRSNDNFYKHVSSVGNEHDVQRKKLSEQGVSQEDNCVENSLSESSFENWLIHLDNAELHNAINRLSKTDQRILYLLYVHGLSQEECGQVLHIPQRTISHRHYKIITNLRNTLKRC